MKMKIIVLFGHTRSEVTYDLGSVRPSVRSLWLFLGTGSLFFSDFLHDVRNP
jgi:hypothetical protein